MAVTSRDIVAGLERRGVPKVAAIALAGNSFVESKFDTSVNEKAPVIKGSRGGYGLMQWTGPRRKQLEAFAGSQKKPLSDLDTQLDFLAWELANTEKDAAQKIYSARSVEDAAKAVSNNFLRPGIPHLGRRVSAAMDIAGGMDIPGADMSGGDGSDVIAGSEGGDSMSDWRGLTPDQEQSLYEAYTKGKMSARQRADYENDIRSGRIGIPTGVSVFTPLDIAPDQAATLLDAYNSGQMSDEQRKDYEADVRLGVVPLPEGYGLSQGQIQSVQPSNEPMASDLQYPDSPQVPTIGDEPAQAAPDAPFFDIATDMASGPWDAAKQAAAGAMGTGPSVGTEMIPSSVPILSQNGASIPVPEAVRNIGGRVLDAGLAGAGALGAVYSGAVGVGADIAEGLGMPKGSAQRMARDVSSIPEAFAGSPTSLPMGTPRIPAVDKVDTPSISIPTPRVEPTLKPLDAPRTLTSSENDKMRSLIAKAAANNKAARAELASLAKVDLEAKAAADRLGIDAPVDVFADDPAIQQASGIVRSVRGMDAAAEWEATFKNAQTRAQEIMTQEGGSPDLATTSETIRSSLTSSIDDLRQRGGAIYEDIKGQIPTGSQVAPSATVTEFNKIITELGGTESLGGPVKKLFDAITSDQGMTYGRLMQERSQIGRAAFKNQGPYADADERTLKALYAALGKDQSNFVEATVGNDAAKRLADANGLWSSARDLEKSLLSGFGKDAQGSIAAKLTSAITTASKGDVAGLNRVLSIIPDDLKREAVLTAIDSLAQGTGAQGGFSFARYAKNYRGLRNNAPVYAEIAKVIGKPTADIMRDLYEVSVRIDRAAQNVPRTGMSNQALIADGLISNVLNSTAGRAARSAMGGTIGGALGGPVAGGITAAAAGSGRIGKGRAQAVGNLFRSSEFQRLASEAATKPTVSPANLKAVQKSAAFRNWAKKAHIKDPNAWLLGALAAQQSAEVQTAQ